MKIALDWGGVISMAPDGWGEAILSAREKGHWIFLLSHAISEEDLKARTEFAKKWGIYDLSFILPPHDEGGICERKARLCKENQIEFFLDDYPGRCAAVAAANPTCIVLCVPQQHWQFGFEALMIFKEYE